VLRAALETLSPNHRDVIKLRYIEELSYEEIALRLGITPSNVGVRLSRALAHLKATMHVRVEACPTSKPHLRRSPAALARVIFGSLARSYWLGGSWMARTAPIS
jgi:hypothetical protein